MSLLCFCCFLQAISFCFLVLVYRSLANKKSPSRVYLNSFLALYILYLIIIYTLFNFSPHAHLHISLAYFTCMLPVFNYLTRLYSSWSPYSICWRTINATSYKTFHFWNRNSTLSIKNPIPRSFLLIAIIGLLF